jgi:tRNA(fMet)-specific endonuclease VapC
MGLILDTSEFIFAERSSLSVRDLLARFDESDPVGISVITLAELQHGVGRAANSEQRTKRKQFITDVISSVSVIEVNVEIALRAGDLDSELQMRGEGLPLDDLIIAATALVLNAVLVTGNTRHFSRVSGLQLGQPRR